jgi:hypothetical protein
MSSASGTLTANAPIGAAFSPAAGLFSALIGGVSAKNGATLQRSLDGGTTWAALVKDAFSNSAFYTSDTTFDITESRSGAQYRFVLTTLNSATVPVIWQFYQ